MTASARFWDKIADGYAKQPIGDADAYKEKLRRTQALLKPEDSILEFACGTGGTALAHAPFVHKVTAIDISERMIAHCEQNRLKAEVDNVEFQQQTIEAYPSDPEQFDAVLGLSILHLLEDRAPVLAKVNRLLKPGGYFVSSTVCLGDSMPWFRFIAPIGRWTGKMPLVQTLKEADLQQELQQAGFEVVDQWRPNPKAAVFMVARKPL